MHNKLSQIEQLVRLGFISPKQLHNIKKAVMYADQGMTLPDPERSVFYQFVDRLVDMTIGDPAIFRYLRNRTITSTRNESMSLTEASTGVKSSANHTDDIKAKVAADIQKRKDARKTETDKALSAAKAELDSTPAKEFKRGSKIFVRKEDVEEIDVDALFEAIELRKASDGILQQFANIMHSKRRAGGVPTDEDRKLATRAKAELRRRRNMSNADESIDYSEKLSNLMLEYSITSLDELDEAQKTQFFSEL